MRSTILAGASFLFGLASAGASTSTTPVSPCGAATKYIISAGSGQYGTVQPVSDNYPYISLSSSSLCDATMFTLDSNCELTVASGDYTGQLVQLIAGTNGEALHIVPSGTYDWNPVTCTLESDNQLFCQSQSNAVSAELTDNGVTNAWQLAKEPSALPAGSEVITTVVAAIVY